MASRHTTARSYHQHLGRLILGLGLTSCSDGPTNPSDLQLLEGTWVEISTDHPELRPGVLRCFTFYGDSTYVWDDVFPATSETALVPSALHRWQGRTVLRNDSLTRWMYTDDLYTGFDGVTLVPYWLHDSVGGRISLIRLQAKRMTLTSENWVQDIGIVISTDVYHRGNADECAQPLAGIIR